MGGRGIFAFAMTYELYYDYNLQHIMAAYELQGDEEVCIWPQSTEVRDEDLVYHKACPISCK